MSEKRFTYESNVVAPLKIKTISNGTPPFHMEKKRRRTFLKPEKSNSEMIAIVLRLIEYFENH